MKSIRRPSYTGYVTQGQEQNHLPTPVHLPHYGYAVTAVLGNIQHIENAATNPATLSTLNIMIQTTHSKIANAGKELAIVLVLLDSAENTQKFCKTMPLHFEASDTLDHHYCGQVFGIPIFSCQMESDMYQKGTLLIGTVDPFKTLKPIRGILAR